MTKIATSVIKADFRITARIMMATTALLACATAYSQNVNVPPSIDQETKGTPAVVEIPSSQAKKSESSVEADSKEATKSIFGSSKVTEFRRENGQVYLIELEHSSGSKQYIEETDSDGKIESTSNDIEETPNLPKWKLGSW